MNTISGTILGFVTVTFINSLRNNIKTKLEMNDLFLFIFSICFALAAVFIWEEIEYFVDAVSNSNIQGYINEESKEILLGHLALKNTMENFFLSFIGVLFANALTYIEFVFRRENKIEEKENL